MADQTHPLTTLDDMSGNWQVSFLVQLPTPCDVEEDACVDGLLARLADLAFCDADQLSSVSLLSLFCHGWMR